MTYGVGNLGPSLGHAQRYYGGVRPFNGIHVDI